ncbi:hypothetical protein R50073_22810 [Maricurvus nonylphenolicus]|uniref:DUF6763 family protein n=1 Tax=Maricurvus nonylphenolicus TaxID=1008307 RepID=UPI0036F3DF6E
MSLQLPTIGEWYYNPIGNEYFEVVAVDDQSATIEIQYAGGEVSEYDIEAWQQLSLTPASPPEDAGAAYESGYENDWVSDDTLHPESWMNPLSAIEPDSFPGIDDF